MSRLILSKVATPSAPAAGKTIVFIDTTDNKLKTIDENGIISPLVLDGWRDHPTIGNGEFEFWQRQVAGTATAYSSIGGRVYSADRWFISNENASVNAQRIDTETAKEAGLGSRYYGQFSKITNTGKFLVGQLLSATVICDMRNSLTRLQFNLKASAAMTVRLGLIQLAAAGTVDVVPINAGTFVTAWGANTVDPTLGANLAYIAPVANSADGGTISGNALSCVLSTSWKRFSTVFLPPIDCHDLMLCVWTDSQLTSGQSISLGEVGLYDGPEIRTNFVAFPSSLEFLRLQRYYQKTFPILTAPAQNAGIAGSLRDSVAIAGAVTTSTTMQWRYGVPMRAAPSTVTFYNPSAANAFMRNVPAASDATATSAANITEFSLDVNCTGIAGWTTVGQELRVHCTADAEL